MESTDHILKRVRDWSPPTMIGQELDRLSYEWRAARQGFE